MKNKKTRPTPMFVSEYNDMTVVCRNIETGSEAFVVKDHPNLAAGTLHGYLCKIEHVIKRSDNPAVYDADDSIATIEKFKGNYNFSAEFITDKDCYYVWMSILDHVG